MYKLKILTLSIILLMILSVAPPPPVAYAQAAAFVNLLTVSNFAALAATAVTSAAPGTTINGGNLGITGVGCTDFPAPCQTPGVGGLVIGGAIITPGGAATTGQTDATAVVLDLNSRVSTGLIGPGGLTGLTLTQGVYDVTSVGGGGDDLTGNLTLNGNANSVFIFRFNDTFITSGTARILFNGGVRSCNVYWWTPSSATFVGATQMAGTVFALTNISFPAGGAVVNGRVIAENAAINFNNTTINNIPVCVPVVAPPGPGGGGGGGGGEEEEAWRPSVKKLPNTGGAPIRNEDFPWSLAIAVGGFGFMVLALGVRAYRRTHLSKR